MSERRTKYALMTGAAFALLGILLSKDTRTRFDQVAFLLLCSSLPCLAAYALTEVKEAEEHDWEFVIRMLIYIVVPVMLFLALVCILAAREKVGAILFLTMALLVYRFVLRRKRNIPI